MKGFRNILIQFAISFTVLWSVFVWYAAWNDVVNDGDSLTHTMWNDLVTQVGTISSAPFLKWYLDGLTIENDSWDTNNDILVNVWTAASSDNTQYIDLGTVITKDLMLVGVHEIMRDDWQLVRRHQIHGTMYLLFGNQMVQ